jgi:hypothetical protein
VSERQSRSPSARRRASPSRAALIEAFYQGAELAAIAVICDAAGIRVAAANHDGEGMLEPGEAIALRWWCRRGPDAAKVADVATARLRRGEPKARAANAAAGTASVAAPLRMAQTAIEAAAKQCGVMLHPDDEIDAVATAIVARLDQEIERLQQRGELKSVNRSYRIYRTELAARGEKVLLYGEWMKKYKENLVRQLAAAWRYG